MAEKEAPVDKLIASSDENGDIGSLPGDSKDSGILNENGEIDEIEQLEGGVPNGIIHGEEKKSLEEMDEPVDRESKTPNDLIERNESSVEIGSHVSINPMNDATKWNPFVLTCALSLLLGVIVGIILLSQRERESSPSSTLPLSSNEPSIHPSISPSFIYFDPAVISDTPSTQSSPAPDISSTKLPVSPTVVPYKEPTRYPISTLPATRIPSTSPTIQTSLLPTEFPSTFPTRNTSSPSTKPSVAITNTPSNTPTNPPTTSPSTQAPSTSPTPPRIWFEIPANDVCALAIGPLPSDFSSNFGTIKNAGIDNVDRCGDVLDSGPGVWYYTVGTGGEMMAHTCLDTKFNSKVTIFGGSCDKPLCIEANDNFCGSSTSQSAVSWNSIYGEFYYVLVTGNEDFEDGSFNLVVGARSNDECSTSIGPLEVGDSTVSVKGSTIGANANQNPCDDFNDRSSSVWYLIRGTGGEMTVDLCEETNFSTRIAVLTGSCRELECITVSSYNRCTVTWKSDLSRSYYILIGGQRTDDVGNFSLRLSTTNLPDNNECKNAVGPLSLGGIPIKGSTASASPNINIPFCISAVTANGLWYYVEGNGSTIQASLCDSQSYDTRLSVYRGNCIDDDELSGLVCIDGNDDFCGKQSLVTWESEFRTKYYIFVHGYLEESGDFSLTVTTL